MLNAAVCETARSNLDTDTAMNLTPHTAQNTSRRTAIDRRTTRYPGYTVSQRIRKRDNPT